MLDARRNLICTSAHIGKSLVHAPTGGKYGHKIKFQLRNNSDKRGQAVLRIFEDARQVTPQPRHTLWHHEPEIAPYAPLALCRRWLGGCSTLHGWVVHRALREPT